MTTLVDTTAAEVAAAITRERRRTGAGAAGMVLTLVVDTDPRRADEALAAAVEASREHPCRVIGVVRRTPKAKARLDAEIRTGAARGPGETVLLTHYGQVGDHADSVVLPLLLPDTPVVVWWPGAAPDDPADHPLGRLAQRRITDAAGSGHQPTRPAPGDTDLAWTRLTPWRTLLASALDEPYDPITAGHVVAARGNPSAPLLAAWLSRKLAVPVATRTSRGPGITEARLDTSHGSIAVTRPDGVRATLSRPGQPERNVALPRRRAAELLAEELRWLDVDEVYRETLEAMITR